MGINFVANSTSATSPEAISCTGSNAFALLAILGHEPGEEDYCGEIAPADLRAALCAAQVALVSGDLRAPYVNATVEWVDLGNGEPIPFTCGRDDAYIVNRLEALSTLLAHCILEGCSLAWG